MRVLEEISVEDVNRWLDTCPLDATPKREAYIMLRAIMRCAVQPPGAGAVVGPVAVHGADPDPLDRIRQ